MATFGCVEVIRLVSVSFKYVKQRHRISSTNPTQEKTEIGKPQPSDSCRLLNSVSLLHSYMNDIRLQLYPEKTYHALVMRFSMSTM